MPPIFRQLLLLLPAAVVVLLTPSWANSQLTPDNTLGPESSAVNELDSLNQLVEGGAIRGSNLYHSFSEFNIAEGNSVNFTNPANVEFILTRVTGSTQSDILGQLGVLGEADLFLMNPNGIVFGENSSLDISGSFYAVTADALQVGDGIFSAVDPPSSRLLEVSPEVSFFKFLTDTSGGISVEDAQLVVEEDFTLVASALTLSGPVQLIAKGDLRLLTPNDRSLIWVRLQDPTKPGTIFFAAGGGGSGGNFIVETSFFIGIPSEIRGNVRFIAVGGTFIRSGFVLGFRDLSLEPIDLLEDSLADLPDDLIASDSLISTSCIAPNNQTEGSFTIPGARGLPQTPADSTTSIYPTTPLQVLTSALPNPPNHQWQVGDPIVEARSVEQLENNLISFSRYCKADI